MAEETQLTIRCSEPQNASGVMVVVEARHGTFGGGVTLWCAFEEFRSVGQALMAFPTKVPDKYEHYFEDHNENFSLSVRTTDSTGRSTLTIYLVSNRGGTCDLNFLAEPLSINRLGSLFMGLADLSLREIEWTPLTPMGS